MTAVHGRAATMRLPGHLTTAHPTTAHPTTGHLTTGLATAHLTTAHLTTAHLTTGRLATAHLATGQLSLGGGGGLAHLLVRLVIWHELWRLARIVWRIPTFGPIIIVAAVLALLTLAILRRRGGRRWPLRGRGGSGGYGSGTGPRDW